MDQVVRLAAVGDIHCTKSSQGALQPIFAGVAEQADVLVLCGDLTDYGQPEEAHILARELASRSITVNALAPGFIETDMTSVLGEPVRE